MPEDLSGSHFQPSSLARLTYNNENKARSLPFFFVFFLLQNSIPFTKEGELPSSSPPSSRTSALILDCEWGKWGDWATTPEGAQRSWGGWVAGWVAG
jgi:hypothetical protein